MGAPKGFVSSVRSEVSLEQPGSREALAADVAGVGEVVGEHVHGQGRHAHVELLADVARLRCLRGELAVGLLVSRQVGAGGKMLSTLGTLMNTFLMALEAGSTIVEEQGVFGEGFYIGVRGRNRGGQGCKRAVGARRLCR